MLGAEEEKESNVTLRKERESYNNVFTYFHEIKKKKKNERRQSHIASPTGSLIRVHKVWRQALTIDTNSPSGTSVDGWRRDIGESNPKSVLSQFGVLCPGRQARVKPRPVPPPQGPGGRCRGTDGRCPSSSDT